MDEQTKLIIIITTLKKLGYTKEQVEKGINKLDESKYTEINISEIVNDIVKNIEKGEN